MAILELRAALGWSARQAADRFHVSATTLGSWKARIDERGPNALLRIPIPVNKFPDLVRYIVRRLKLLCPRLGKVKIAEMLCRAGLHLAPTTVGRFLRADLRWPPRWLSLLHRDRSSRLGDRTNSGMWTCRPSLQGLASGPPGVPMRCRSSGRSVGGSWSCSTTTLGEFKDGWFLPTSPMPERCALSSLVRSGTSARRLAIC